MCLSLCCVARPTHADATQGPVPVTRDIRTGSSIALLTGYGHEFVQGLQGLNFGVGVTGGYTLSPHIYLGASAISHFGSTERARTSSYHYANRHSEYALSLEAGYDFLALQRWVLRPIITTGMFVDNASTSIGASSLSSHDVYGFVGFGLSTFVRIDRFRVGMDWRVPVFPSAFVARLMLTGYLTLGVTL
jgi:hypothetical protein